MDKLEKVPQSLRDTQIAHTPGCLQNEETLQKIGPQLITMEEKLQEFSTELLRLSLNGKSNKTIKKFLKRTKSNKTQIKKLTKSTTMIQGALTTLREKIESEYNYLNSMMQCILVEFQDHRQALYLFLEANGISCDDIKGWNVNDYTESTPIRGKSRKRKRRRKKRKGK